MSCRCSLASIVSSEQSTVHFIGVPENMNVAAFKNLSLSFAL